MNKILIANRGEIACRICKTIRRMGMQSVAVYSEADRFSPHTQMADYAVCIGAAPSSESYLNAAAIIRAAKETGADAIHPGYGFLSENAAFAELVQSEGLIFIGPDPHAIRVMGDKLTSKETVKPFGIPMVPSTENAVSNEAQAKNAAREIGFPVLIKASAGGGGKGMRVVHREEDMDEQMARAIGEARAAFGDGSVFIEKYIANPKHIEIQILADNHGNIVYLFERECSIQRRNQKVVEEAPSAIVSPELRKEMGEAAVRVAAACGYKGAGTVEFLVDRDNGFYFLEMNTRLQVEHPVTEFITGLDLVEQQINIAKGDPLPFTQDDLSIHGHAIELRVYAENPHENFTPDVGVISKYKLPAGKNVRVDDGIQQGAEVSVYYDPMLAKLITWGKDRAEAIQQMREAIDQYLIEGVSTTLPFGHFVCNHPAFLDGTFDTGFVEKFYTPEAIEKIVEQESQLAAQIALSRYLQEMETLRLPNHSS